MTAFQLNSTRIIHMMVKVNVDVISERFWLVPACEPSALLTAFLERFQSACLLAQQLPAMKPEQLKSMVRQERSVFRSVSKMPSETLLTLFILQKGLP